MNRRGFIKNITGFLAGLAVLPSKVLSYDPVKEKVVKPVIDYNKLVAYKGDAFLNSGIVYAPYIPIIVTDQLTTSSLSDRLSSKWLKTAIDLKKKPN